MDSEENGRLRNAAAIDSNRYLYRMHHDITQPRWISSPHMPKTLGSAYSLSAVHQEFVKTFRVQRKNVEIWLNYLVLHHPDYRDLIVDQERLSQLPDDETVMDELETVTHEEEDDVNENGVEEDSNTSFRGRKILSFRR